MYVGSLPTPPTSLSTATLPAPAVAVQLTVPNSQPASTIPSAVPSTLDASFTATAISVDAIQADFSGGGDPATYSDPGAVAAPEYGVSASPLAVPSVNTPSLSATRPDASYLSTDINAGLSQVEKPVVDVLARIELASIKDLTYSPVDIALFSGEVPAYTPYEVQILNPSDETRRPIAELDTFIISVESDGVSTSAQTFVPLADEKTAYLAVEETRAKEKIFADAAARGFSLPNGVVSGATAALAESAVRARNKIDNEAYEAFNDASRKEFVSRVGAHVAALKLAYSRALSVVGQQIKILRFNVQMGTEVYNAAVESYNKQAQIVREYVGAYRAYVSALSTQDEAVIAKISLARAQIQTDQADWGMYRDQLGLVETAIEVDRLSVEQAAFVLKEFEQKVRGYQQNTELARINIEAFGQQVRSLNEQVQVQVSAFEMYKDEADTAASQFAVAEANVGAYNAFLESDAARVQAFSRAVSDSVSALAALAGEYQEYGQAHRSYLQVKAAEIRATDSANRAALDYSERVLQANAAIERAKIEVAAAKDAQKLATAEFDMRAAAIAAQAFAEQVRIDSALEAAKATAASSVAQAAASTTSISARVSDDGNFNERFSYSDGYSVTEIGRRGWSSTTNIEEAAA